MKIRIWTITFLLLSWLSVCAQKREQRFRFENNFKGVLPTCAYDLAAANPGGSCAPFQNTARFVTDSVGCQMERMVFQSRYNSGLVYKNTQVILTDNYTIQLYVKNLAWGENPVEIVNFGSTKREGLVVNGDPSNGLGTLYFNSQKLPHSGAILKLDKYYLLTLTRDKNSNKLDIYIDNQRIETIDDALKKFVGKPDRPVVLYSQTPSAACETGISNIAYLMVRDEYSNPQQLKSAYENRCLLSEKDSSLQFVIDPDASCRNQDIKVEFVGNVPEGSQYEFKWDFKDAKVVSGSGRGPYVLHWGKAGKKVVDLKVINKNCGVEMLISNEKYICGVEGISVKVDDKCTGFAEITLEPQEGTMPFYYSFNGEHFNEKNQYKAPDGDYKVAFMDKHSCPVDTVIHVKLKEPALVKTIGDISICEGESLELNTTSNADFISWSPSYDISDYTARSPTATPTQTTTYIATASKDICVTTDTVTVTVLPSPHIVVSPDAEVEELEPYQLFVKPLPHTSAYRLLYLWAPAEGLDNPYISLPIATLEETQTYTVSATNDFGCTAIDTTTLHVRQKPHIYIPNAFTPNQDSHNQKFKPIYISIITLHQFSIYNRDGQLIFHTDDQKAGWDGTFRGSDAPPGTYTYLLRATSSEGDKMERRGNVILMR